MKRHGYLKIFLFFLIIFILTVTLMGIHDYNQYRSANRKMNEYRGIIETETIKRTRIVDSILVSLEEPMGDDFQAIREINEQLKETSDLGVIVSKNVDLRRQMNYVQQNLSIDQQGKTDLAFEEFALTESALSYAIAQYNDTVLKTNKIQRHIPLRFFKEFLKFEPQSYLYYGE